MSKIRQAVAYEHNLSEEKVSAHKELTDQAFEYERLLSDAKVEGHVAVRNEALAYERKITDQQFGTIKALSDEHRLFHDREHLLYDDAVEKASSALHAQLATLQGELDRLIDASHGFMSTVRFEREHQQLIDRIEEKFETYDERLGTEREVTVRQATKDELMEQIASNRRWIIGLAIGFAGTGVTLILRVLNAI